ncbi:hypothetical protein Tco_0216962 [Tanacetum coccineum]
MKMKDTFSSCSDSEEQEMQRMQMQAKILKENSLNEFNALKTTTQRLKRNTFPNCPLFQRAFSSLFSNDIRTFKFELFHNMNNLEKQLNKETLHEKDSKSDISVVKVQFDKFLYLEELKPSNYDDRHIQECKIQDLKAMDASSGNKVSNGFVSDKGNVHCSENDCHKTGNDQSSENKGSTSGNESKPMAEVPYTTEYNVFAVETQHTEQPEFLNDASLMEKVNSNTTPDSSDMCNKEIKGDQYANDHEDERVVLAYLIANLKLDIDENKKIQKQLRNTNTSLAHELKE